MHVNHYDLDSEKDVMLISPNNTTLRNITNGNTKNSKPWVNGPHRITLDQIRVQQQDIPTGEMHQQLDEQTSDQHNQFANHAELASPEYSAQPSSTVRVNTDLQFEDDGRIKASGARLGGHHRRSSLPDIHPKSSIMFPQDQSQPQMHKSPTTVVPKALKQSLHTINLSEQQN